MPNLKQHIKSSKERTGESWEKLHKWMDESQEFLGIHHRNERHSTIYLKYVKDEWGKEGVVEFLTHIIEDYKSTLSKYETKCADCGKDSYGKPRCFKCWKKKRNE